MDALWVWVTIGLLTLATLLTRVGFLLFGTRVNLPPAVERALRYAPACALAAIIVPELLFTQGQLNLSWHNDRLLAALGAAIFFFITRSMLWTIVVGMLLYTALRIWF